MGGYAKIWTDIFNDQWFISMSCTGRGLWLQLIVYCKQNGDDGVIFLRNITQGATIFALDRSTFVRELRNFAENSRVELNLDNKPIMIKMLNYQYWQALTVKDASTNKCQKMTPDKSTPQQTTPVKIKADKNNKSNSVNTSTSGDKTNHREVDSSKAQEIKDLELVVKAIRLIGSRSLIFQTCLMQNGDLHKKVIDWSRECFGLPWIMFCIGHFWWRYRDGDDGLNDPFASLADPMGYLYSLIFPRKFNRLPTFDTGAKIFDNRQPAEWWYRTFEFDRMENESLQRQR